MLQSYVVAALYATKNSPAIRALDPFWLVNEHDMCAVKGPSEYTPRILFPPGSDVTLTSTQIVIRHGARGEHQKTTCFNDGQQTKYTCGHSTAFELVSKPGLVAKSPGLVKVYHGDAAACSQGQLLDLGIEQVSRLGQWLKASYGSSHLNPSNLERIRLYSTDTQRTFATLDILTSELFPNQQTPFLVETVEFLDDIFALKLPTCPAFVHLRSTFESSPSYIQKTDSRKFRKCAALWKRTFHTDLDLKYADDCLLSSYCANVPLPGNPAVPPALFQCVMDISFALRGIKLGGDPLNTYYLNGQRICQLNTFRVFQSFAESVKKGDVAGLYSLHDETFVCLLTSLGIWDGVWPKYAEAMAFEYYSDGSVRIVRDGKAIALLPNLDLDLVRDEAQWTNLCKREF